MTSLDSSQFSDVGVDDLASTITSSADLGKNRVKTDVLGKNITDTSEDVSENKTFLKPSNLKEKVSQR